jgi:hypothetical protein
MVQFLKVWILMIHSRDRENICPHHSECPRTHSVVDMRSVAAKFPAILVVYIAVFAASFYNGLSDNLVTLPQAGHVISPHLQFPQGQTRSETLSLIPSRNCVDFPRDGSVWLRPALQEWQTMGAASGNTSSGCRVCPSLTVGTKSVRRSVSRFLRDSSMVESVNWMDGL